MNVNLSQPAIIPDAPRIIVIGDIHGDVERLVKVVKSIGLFSNDLQWIAEPKNTVVIQLGDQIDGLSRSSDNLSDGWEKYPDVEVLQLMDRLDAIAQAGGGRVLSLLGNHEIMNTQGIFNYVSSMSMDAVGGFANRAALFSPGNQFAQILSRRNIVASIGPFLFCHGGLLPEHLDAVYNNFITINNCMQKYLRGEELSSDELFVINNIIVNPETGIVWLRKYVELADHQPDILEHLIDNVCQRTNTMVLFVGHNTMESIKRTSNGKLYFTDAGFSRAYSIHGDYVEVIEIVKNETNYNVETLRVSM
jgi:hypothetical protein